MKEQNIKKMLAAYTVGSPPGEAIEKTKTVVLSVAVKRSVPKFSAGRFLKGQFHTLRASFWVISAIYLILVSAVSLKISSANAVVMLCAATPFLAVAAVPTLFYDSNPMSMELESSCLYQPKTALAAKMVLCGAVDLSAVVFCSVLCSVFTGGRVGMTVILGLISFLAAAFLTLGVSVLFKTQTAVLISIALFCSASGFLFSSHFMKEYILSLTFAQLSFITLTVLVLLVSALTVTFKKYNYERLGVQFGD